MLAMILVVNILKIFTEAILEEESFIEDSRKKKYPIMCWR